MSNDRLESNDRVPSLPPPGDRMPVAMCAAPHPATLSEDGLLEQCELRTQRRSGPGGQHRNKTSSGAFLQHKPTGIVAEATERRSQAENRDIACARLRLRLAVEIRTPSILDRPTQESAGGAIGKATDEDRENDSEEQAFRQRYVGSGLRIGAQNPAKPAVLALLLNDLHAGGGQPSAIAPQWQTTTSAVVRFIKTHPPAFVLLNEIRRHHGRSPLK